MWGALAFSEAKNYCAPALLFDGQEAGYTHLPQASEITAATMDQLAYVHYVDNETVHGIEFQTPPVIDPEVPLIADMSSNLLTRPVDFSKFAMVYACAQKNIGPAGITIAIIREDLLAREPILQTPSILNYQMQVKKESMVNTPATYPWYAVGLMTDWVSSVGGVSVMHERALARSSQLYAYIDQSDFYHNAVDPAVRSRINVVFKLRDETLNAGFLSEAEALGLSGLKGHRATGGMRASMYNAMPQAGSDNLLAHMQAFEARHR
jgi:phosphoserine aminotransferase